MISNWPLPPDFTGRSPEERIPVEFRYNGGFPRTHTVSIGLLQRLEAYMRKHKRVDCVWTEVYAGRPQ